MTALTDRVKRASVSFGTPLQGRLTWWQRVAADHQQFYRSSSICKLAGGMAVGAAMANTSVDRKIQRRFQSSLQREAADDWFEMLHAQKELGNGLYTLPVYAVTWVAGEFSHDESLLASASTWGARSLRGTLVGAPAVLGLQRATGGSRPGESSTDSRWHPLQDNNGISGHSFMGALPFITAAKMTDQPLLKTACYAGSALAPLSRVNDDAHYFSQALLGWWIALLAAEAVEASEVAPRSLTIVPFNQDGSNGFMAEVRW